MKAMTHPETSAGNDVVCGGHWHGLSGEPVNGSTGCPWCHVAELQAEVARLERARDNDGRALAEVCRERDALRSARETPARCDACVEWSSPVAEGMCGATGTPALATDSCEGFVPAPRSSDATPSTGHTSWRCGCGAWNHAACRNCGAGPDERWASKAELDALGISASPASAPRPPDPRIPDDREEET